MYSAAIQLPINDTEHHINSIMEVDDEMGDDEDGNDAFLAFIEYAGSVLSHDGEEGDDPGLNNDGGEPNGPGWSWITSLILKTCLSYSSGVTPAILLSELSQAWSEQCRSGALKKRPELINQLKRNHRRTKLQNTVTIDSIHEKNFLSLDSVLEVVVIDVFSLPGTNIYMLTFGDFWSSNTIDLYLHRRYYNLVDPVNGVLKKGREVFLTGCYLRAVTGGPRHLRLLPTEYLVILLDEDQDDDAMLLGAQFCSDSFSSISLGAVAEGVSYSLYGRIESVGMLETLGKHCSLQRREISLVDNDGLKLKFVLWGEQVVLAKLFSLGGMLALDQPFVSSSLNSDGDACEELCLEYGSATQLYLVPFVQHEEQVCVTLPENRCHGSRLLGTLLPSQGPKVSQLTLPCDSQGSVDFSNYPFRTFVIDLRDKMTSVSLYGAVTDIMRESNTKEVVFVLKIEDPTGAIRARLCFMKSWSRGRLCIGHTVYISALTCVMTKQRRLEVRWFENDAGASIINMSNLPVLLNSSCLHQLTCLSDLSSETRTTHICQIRLDLIERYHVDTRFAHSICGHFVSEARDGCVECSFCHCSCGDEIVRTFHLKITLADESGKVFAWCTGATATELLQISPDEFYELPEDEQVMYPASLESERFMVAVVNCRRPGGGPENDDVGWEITRALKL